jgi:hypothetical protein
MPTTGIPKPTRPAAIEHRLMRKPGWAGRAIEVGRSPFAPGGVLGSCAPENMLWIPENGGKGECAERKPRYLSGRIR